MSEESVENEKGDVRHHGSSSQVTSPGFLEIIGFLFTGGHGCLCARDILRSQLGDIESAELGIPVCSDLDINKHNELGIWI